MITLLLCFAIGVGLVFVIGRISGNEDVDTPLEVALLSIACVLVGVGGHLVRFYLAPTDEDAADLFVVVPALLTIMGALLGLALQHGFHKKPIGGPGGKTPTQIGFEGAAKYGLPVLIFGGILYWVATTAEGWYRSLEWYYQPVAVVGIVIVAPSLVKLFITVATLLKPADKGKGH